MKKHDDEPGDLLTPRLQRKTGGGPWERDQSLKEDLVSLVDFLEYADARNHEALDNGQPMRWRVVDAASGRILGYE